MEKKYLVSPAMTNSDCDISLVIVEITDEFLETIKETKQVIDSFPKDFVWEKLSTFSNFAKFKSDDSDDLDLCNLVNENALIIDKSIINFDVLSDPEYDLTCQQIMFSKKGFSIKCYCKHSQGEFWCDTISYSILD